MEKVNRLCRTAYHSHERSNNRQCVSGYRDVGRKSPCCLEDGNLHVVHLSLQPLVGLCGCIGTDGSLFLRHIRACHLFCQFPDRLRVRDKVLRRGNIFRPEQLCQVGHIVQFRL